MFKMQKSNLLARTEGSQSIGGKDSEVKGSHTILNLTGCGEHLFQTEEGDTTELPAEALQ